MSVFRKYGSFYMAAGTAAIALRIYCGGADSDGLLWILAPVAWWVRILSGTAYEYLPGVGYVNHAFQFVIAPSCSGVRFLIIVMLMSVFSRMPEEPSLSVITCRICLLLKLGSKLGE